MTGACVFWCLCFCAGVFRVLHVLGVLGALDALRVVLRLWCFMFFCVFGMRVRVRQFVLGIVSVLFCFTFVLFFCSWKKSYQLSFFCFDLFGFRCSKEGVCANKFNLLRGLRGKARERGCRRLNWFSLGWFGFL